MKKIFLFILCASSIVISSCSQFVKDKEVNILAKVNGTLVQTEEFMIKFQQLKAEQDELSIKNPRVLNELKTKALNEAIILALVKEEARKRRIIVTREEVEGRLANWKDGYPSGGFEKMLHRQNTTERFLKHRISEQLLVSKLIRELFSSETLVSDEEMKRYHKKNAKEFYKPAKVHAYQIVVPTIEEAKKIRQEIVAGKITFQSAARKYSLSPDAAKGGDVGFFSRNEKIPAFNRAFRLRVEDISKPIKSQYGVHLIKVVEKQMRRRQSYEEAKSSISTRLKKQKEARVYKEWVTKLLKEGKIYRNEKKFKEIS